MTDIKLQSLYEPDKDHSQIQQSKNLKVLILAAVDSFQISFNAILKSKNWWKNWKITTIF